MPLGYKYVQRNADSQINWAEVGREASGMLLEVNRVREEKKEALAQAQRESLDNLMNSPQGKNQDVNGVVNTFAHDLIEQKKIDYDLLTRGQMSVRDYTLKAQNQMDGTKRIFDIAKALQDTRQATLDGISDGTLSTAINVFNRGMVEQYQDMSKLGINVTSPDGTINIGLYEDKTINGETVRVLKENIASPNVILGKIAQTVPAFDVNKANSAYTAGLGTKKDYWYEAATTAGAGTITELTGVQFLETLKRPSDIAIVKNINDSINAQVSMYFSDEYKLMDVLGDKLGKYNSTSFTFDKNVADADENKILVMVNPLTGMTSLDINAKNYKKQLAEASEYVRTDILSKMDAERTIKPTAQSQLQESAETIARVKKKYEPKPKADEDADTATNMIGKLWYGDDNQVSSSITYFKGLKNDKGQVLFKDIIREPKGITVLLADGTKEYVDFLDKDGRPKTQEDFIASVGPLLAGQLDVSKSLKTGSYEKGAKFNATSYGRVSTIEEFALPTDVLAKPSQEAVSDINNALPQGFTAKDIGGTFGNEVEVTSPTNIKYVVKTKKSAATAATIAQGLEDFIKAQQKIVEEQRLQSVNPKTKTTTTTKPSARNPKGVGSKY